jgi:2',3'-cyclic-nucleotide 2'-phosphodiesterase (5'-nucleotidase family)
MNRFFFVIILFLILGSCRTPKPSKIVYFESRVVESTAEVKPDTSILNIIVPYKEVLEKEMNRKLAFSEFAIEKSKPDGSLNRLTADLTFMAADKYLKDNHQKSLDFALLNHGGLRKSLPKGEINVGNIYELMPFDNMISVVELSGETVQELFDFLAMNNDGHPISNASFEINSKSAQNIIIADEKFDKNRTYLVATNDYLLGGNDGMLFFTKSLRIINTQILVRDAFLNNISGLNLNLYKNTSDNQRVKFVK